MNNRAAFKTNETGVPYSASESVGLITQITGGQSQQRRRRRIKTLQPHTHNQLIIRLPWQWLFIIRVCLVLSGPVCPLFEPVHRLALMEPLGFVHSEGVSRKTV